MFPGVADGQEPGVGEQRAQKFQTDRYAVFRKAGRNAERRKPGVRARFAVGVRLGIADEARFAADGGTDQRVQLVLTKAET